MGYLNDTLVGVLILFFTFILRTPRGHKGIDIPKGWSYNPSTFVQRLPVIILTGLCWFLARYLAAYQLGFIDTMWDPFFGSGTIQVITSDISKALPVPDAGLGALAYTLEFLLGCHGGSARWRTDPWLVLSFGLLVVPVGLISIFLIMLQPLVVHAWCTICLITALAMLLMIMFTIDEVAASLQLLNEAAKPVFPSLNSCSMAYLNSPFASRKPKDSWFLGSDSAQSLSGSRSRVFVMMLPGIFNFAGSLAGADHFWARSSCSLFVSTRRKWREKCVILF